jgi:predicted ATPase
VIASVAFRNFKALRATRLRLGPFNLLIGPNGSGKTSLIQAVLQLRALAKLPLADPEAVTNSDGPEIVFGFESPFETVEARLGCGSEMVCDLLQVRTASPQAWPALQTALSRVRSFVFDHTVMGASAPRASGAVLASNGANLGAVLAWRREQSPRELEQLETEMLRIFPEFSGFVFRADEKNVELALTLADGSGQVPAGDLSQGTLYLLAILTLAFDPQPPTVLCIEEIDRGIHPRMLREVRDALYRLSYPSAAGVSRAATQVIATTQSPYVLDLLREHPEEIVITQKQGTEARFERLADRADLPELLREGSLGDIWFSGILGGVPEEK